MTHDDSHAYDRSGDADRGKSYGRQPPGHRGVDHGMSIIASCATSAGQMDELRSGGNGAFHISNALASASCKKVLAFIYRFGKLSSK